MDNAKYKARFGTKAKMLSHEEAAALIGHAVGGVCPFAVNKGVVIYLDESLKRFDTVFPACGSGNSAIELTIPELEGTLLRFFRVGGCLQRLGITANSPLPHRERVVTLPFSCPSALASQRARRIFALILASPLGGIRLIPLAPSL